MELNGQELDGRKLHVREDRTYIESAEGVVIFVVSKLPYRLMRGADQAFSDVLHP